MDATTSTEPIRLIVWDLDETFWHGTLTEGGIIWRDECRDAVIALARRGIMSTICSKNDPDRVRQVLIEHGVWEYFIFPSHQLAAKGPAPRRPDRSDRAARAQRALHRRQPA